MSLVWSSEEELELENIICVEGCSRDVTGDQWPLLCQVQEREDQEGVARLTGSSQTRPRLADVTLRLKAVGNMNCLRETSHRVII